MQIPAFHSTKKVSLKRVQCQRKDSHIQGKSKRTSKSCSNLDENKDVCVRKTLLTQANQVLDIILHGQEWNTAYAVTVLSLCN